MSHVNFSRCSRYRVFTVAAGTLSLMAGLAGSACAAMAVNERAHAPNTAVSAPHPEEQAAMERTITSVGAGSSARAPDQAEVRLGAVAMGKTAGEAQDALNKTMTNVIKAVKGLNLEGMVVQSEWVNLSPRYEQRERRDRDDEPKIIGYQATNSVAVRLKQVDKTGPVIDAGIAAGANQVMGISLTLKNDKEARSEAITRAAQDARDKAAAAAAALNLRIVGIRAVQTDRAEVRPIYRGRGDMRVSSVSMDSGAPTPIEAGEVAVHAEVTVEFLIVLMESP